MYVIGRDGASVGRVVESQEAPHLHVQVQAHLAGRGMIVSSQSAARAQHISNATIPLPGLVQGKCFERYLLLE